MRNSLQPLYPAATSEAVLKAIGLRPDARAQDLSVEQFAAFYCALHEALVAQATGGADEGGGGGSGSAAEP